MFFSKHPYIYERGGFLVHRSDERRDDELGNGSDWARTASVSVVCGVADSPDTLASTISTLYGLRVPL